MCYISFQWVISAFTEGIAGQVLDHAPLAELLERGQRDTRIDEKI